MGFNKNDYFPTLFVKADDLLDENGKPIKLHVTVESAEEVEYQDGKKAVAIIFAETIKGVSGKRLGLNKTNWEACETMTGCEDPADWQGLRLELYREYVTGVGGKKVWAVRVRPPGGWEGFTPSDPTANDSARSSGNPFEKHQSVPAGEVAPDGSVEDKDVPF